MCVLLSYLVRASVAANGPLILASEPSGTHSGEFTLWNGLTFNFETILQAHNDPIRTMT